MSPVAISFLSVAELFDYGAIAHATLGLNPYYVQHRLRRSRDAQATEGTQRLCTRDLNRYRLMVVQQIEALSVDDIRSHHQ
jgi:hypothetical protein